MKILITGATGKIGNALVERLNADHELVLLSRDSYSQNGKSYKVDLKNHSSLAEVITNEKPDAVIHLAALLPSDCEINPELAYETNVRATEFLARTAQDSKVKVFIFASSSAVYNQKNLAPTDEFHNVNPQSKYGETKQQAETHLIKLSAREQTRFFSLRLFNIYGKNFNDSLVNKLLGSNIDKPAMVYGPDNFYRDYIHILDVVEAFQEMLTSKGKYYEVYNVGTGTVFSNKMLIEELEGAGAKLYFNVKEYGTTISWANIDRIVSSTSWRPKFQLKEFVREFNK